MKLCIIALVFSHFGIEMYGFQLVLKTSPYRTLLLHWFGTRWVFNVLFSLCSDNMSCVIRTLGKQDVLNSTCCFPYVLIRVHVNMLSSIRNNTLKTQRLPNQCNNNALCWDVIRTIGKQYISIPKYPKPMKYQLF